MRFNDSSDKPFTCIRELLLAFGRDEAIALQHKKCQLTGDVVSQTNQLTSIHNKKKTKNSTNSTDDMSESYASFTVTFLLLLGHD